MRTVLQIQAQTAYESGLRFQQERRWDRAEQAFKDALRMDPEYADAAFALGTMYFELSKTHLSDFRIEAAEYLQKAARLYHQRIEQIAEALETMEQVRRAVHHKN